MYEPGKVLILGGSTSDLAIGVTNTAEVIDLNAATPQFRTAGTMQFARTHVNATVLPDGTVLATGGTSARSISEADAILPAELWTPPASGSGPGTWTTLNAMATPRLYHSTAVLLPDATVLSTGGGQGGGYLDHPDYEIFTPPYLCKGRPRPEISSAPQAVAYGQVFTISSPQASSIVSGGRVTLVRLSSVTHCFNMNQRFIELGRASGPTANDIALRIPNNRNVYPPGHYMLFLVDANGTPSHASIIAIDGSVCTSPLTITQSNPNPAESYNTCSRTTIFTVSGGPSGSTYDWTVNGASSYSQGPMAINVYTSTAAPTAQVTVRLHGSTGCGASSALTSYFPGCSEAQ